MAHSNYFAPQSSVEQIKRHPKYYLNGGDVHFLVENYIYRVHRYFFERESAWFREKLGAPAPTGQAPKGSSDANPFPLDDVAADDFSKFLWVFYNPKYSIYDATLEDWTAILKLAFDWRFGEVKKLCSRELEKFIIAPVQKIELYQTYELDKKLLIPSYMALCVRAEPLSLKEGRQLGLETALLLATARECARGKVLANGARSPTAADLEEDDMVSIIKEIFGLTAGPPSPSLTPLEKGTGVATFTGTAPTPTTSPRKGVSAASGTPIGAPAPKAPPAPPETPTKPTSGRPTTSHEPPSVPTIAKPAAPHPSVTASATASRPPQSPFGLGSFTSLVGSVAGELLGTSASPTLAPSSPSRTQANPPAGTGATSSTTTGNNNNNNSSTTAGGNPTTTNNNTTTTSSTNPAPGQSVFSSASTFKNRLMAVLDTQGNPLAPLETQNLPSPGKTPKTAARTPRSWPQPPAAPAPVPAIPKSPPPPPAMPKTPSPPSKAETPRATKAQTPATRASPSAAPRRAAKTRAASGSEPPAARETGVGAGAGGGADPLSGVNAVNDSTDSTDLTNAFDGAGTAAVNTTNITNTISGFPRENSSEAAARKISDEALAGSTVKREKSEDGPVSPAAAQGPLKGTLQTDGASANSQEAPLHASSAGGPSHDVPKPGLDDSSFSTAPAPAGDPAKPTAAAGRSGEEVKPKVSTEGAAATADPLGSKKDVTVKEKPAAGDKKASPLSGKATTHEPPVRKVEDNGPAKPGEKALPPPPPAPENPTAGASGEAKAAAAPSLDKLAVEDNPWGLD